MKKQIFENSFIGKSPQIEKLNEDLIPIVKSDLPVLIYGESGTGKSLLARKIHNISKRKHFPFIDIVMAAIPENLLLSELLGYEAGAFTGARTRKIGLFELAASGTIFLDEIGDLSDKLQKLIIRVVDNNSIMRIGSNKDFKINARIISATNKIPLDENFSNDFLLRLTPFKIFVPPLRERKEDILFLSEHFLEEFNHQFSRNVRITEEAQNVLMEYNFPGNVRELRNTLERLVILKRDDEITAKDLDRIQIKVKPLEKSEKILDLKRELNKSKKEINYLKKSTIIANPIWQGRGFKKENDYCFVLMPFEEKNDMQVVYKDHVKNIVENRCGLRCERADDIYDVSGIMQSVWESIGKAKIIIADLTNRNPNVFYELGIAHTIGKHVIMITQSMGFVPFDLRHLRCIVYEYKPKSIKKFESTLEKTIRTVLASEQYPDIEII